jgi:hypothetical protein
MVGGVKLAAARFHDALAGTSASQTYVSLPAAFV